MAGKKKEYKIKITKNGHLEIYERPQKYYIICTKLKS